VQARLGEARAADLMAEGEAMSLEQAYNYALVTPSDTPSNPKIIS